MLESIRLADEVCLDVFGVGEHHMATMPLSSPTSVINAAAASTKDITLSTSVTVLSRAHESDRGDGRDLEPGFNPRSGRCFVRLAQDDPSRCRDILIELIVKASDTFSVEND